MSRNHNRGIDGYASTAACHNHSGQTCPPILESKTSNRPMLGGLIEDFLHGIQCVRHKVLEEMMIVDGVRRKLPGLGLGQLA